MENHLYTVAGQVNKKLIGFGDNDGSHAEQFLNHNDVGFYERREFFYNLPFSLAVDQSVVIKFVIGVNYIVKNFELTLAEGEVTSEVVIGATESGTFDQDVTILSTNYMDEQDVYATAAAAATGGDITGGVVGDYLILNAGNGTALAASVGGGGARLRGGAAGTVYIKITANQNSTRGVLYSQWEERP